MKIAIAGYGVEGEASYAYWAADPSNEVTIVDGKANTGQPLPTGVKTLLGPDSFKQLDGFDLVIRTAGLAPHLIKTDGRVWSATNEFFAKCPAKIIGVTGSKGKGTTASLIASILKAAGKTVWLIGNIGTPALSVLSQIQPDDIVVYELSSFQLWDLEKSPHVAVVLYIEQEHLDVHANMDEYVTAKSQIARHQTADDLIVYNGENTYATKIAKLSPATKIAYPSSSHAHIVGDMFYYDNHPVCLVSKLRLIGDFNKLNALAAINAVWPYVHNGAVIEFGLNNFTGLPHRLAYVKTVNEVDYYDDSIATTPGSAIAALRAFPDKPKVIILGGSYKGSDFTSLAKELTRHQVKAILIGNQAAAISKACDKAGFEDYEVYENATAADFTKKAASLATPGSVVLLSPAAASFGMFKNYTDRGEQFIAAVNAL